jgi:hypothetical protein
LRWAIRLPIKNERLESAVEAARGSFFDARVILVLPNGEIHAAEITERGRRLVVQGRGVPVTIAGSVLWNLAEAMRKSDEQCAKEST